MSIISKAIALHKDELIQMHQFLLYICKFFQDNGVSKCYFEEYTKANIASHHIHKTKAEHRHAIFLLAKSIASALAAHSDIVPEKCIGDLNRLVERSKRDIW
jgi:hypothetical protein